MRLARGTHSEEWVDVGGVAAAAGGSAYLVGARELLQPGLLRLRRKRRTADQTRRRGDDDGRQRQRCDSRGHHERRVRPL